jgi:hypothetical protein
MPGLILADAELHCRSLFPVQERDASDSFVSRVVKCLEITIDILGTIWRLVGNEEFDELISCLGRICRDRRKARRQSVTIQICLSQTNFGGAGIEFQNVGSKLWLDGKRIGNDEKDRQLFARMYCSFACWSAGCSCAGVWVGFPSLPTINGHKG